MGASMCVAHSSSSEVVKTHGAVEFHAVGYHELPDWCDPNPLITHSMAQKIRETWELSMNEKIADEYYLHHVSSLNHQHNVYAGEGSLRTATTGAPLRQNPPSQFAAEVSRSRGSAVGNLIEDKEKDSNIEESAGTPTAVHSSASDAFAAPVTQAGHHVRISSGSDRVGAVQAEKGIIKRNTSIETPAAAAVQRVEPRSHPSPKSAMVIFFDAFFSSCFSLDPSMELIFNDVKTRADVMSRMIGFLIRNCDKLDDADVKLFIERIAWAHVRSNVQSGHYHTMTMGLLLTFKRMLRNKFTTAHQLAWTTVLSKFFISLFPHLPLKPTIKIKAADSEPNTADRPLNNAKLCSIDGDQSQAEQREKDRPLEHRQPLLSPSDRPKSNKSLIATSNQSSGNKIVEKKNRVKPIYNKDP